MLKKILEIYSTFKNTDRDKYYFKNISNSIITIVNRANFDVSQKWFTIILNKFYDDEIKIKYIPELHQDTHFEQQHLNDILNFKQFKDGFIYDLKNCINFLDRYEKLYNSFHSYLISENNDYKTNIEKNYITFKSSPEHLFNNINKIKDELNKLLKSFQLQNYDLLGNVGHMDLIFFGDLKQINYTHNDWEKILKNEPDYQKVNSFFKSYNFAITKLGDFNYALERFKNNYNYKIIAGVAGTGKSHYLAHLVKNINEADDLAIFLKPKSFNGDHVNFEDKILEILEVPKGYTLAEVLQKLNEFAKNNNKRCFILIDALNETTKSNIGFSNIWKINLQTFINQIKQYNSLYLVCTLRTSYIEKIWDDKPKFLAEIKGFENKSLTSTACRNYFVYYKIDAINFESADLKLFSKPLLLDLFCKLTNGERAEIRKISIDIETYVQVFEDYILDLINEVQQKLNLENSITIENGFNISSLLFYNNLQAILPRNNYTAAFDTNPLISQDNSIARAVLEGYLIFIREVINRHEIIKHTQQEVGGYLIARKLSEDFPNIQLLLQSPEFINRIIGNNENLHHQLRLDILKFLIALRPEIIPSLQDDDSIKLSWDYLFNSSHYRSIEQIPKNLKDRGNENTIFEDILTRSEAHWFDLDSPVNFSLVSLLLQKKDLWNLDLVWNYYIYSEASYMYGYIKEFREINKNFKDRNFEYLKIGSLFASQILSTNIRELRDLATIFLIEFGERFPIELLDLTINFSTYNDIYVYERLVASCYGVMLIKQNDSTYIEKDLPIIAQKLYEAQFSDEPKTPSYNYIVIDSIKHLLDFAILKEAISLSDDQKNRIYNYVFSPNAEWISPDEEQQQSIDESHEMSWPEPIGMDFGIYTIPRLIKQEEDGKREAIANVYKRIFELGYQNLDLRDSNNDIFQDFYWGQSYHKSKGKIDKLGKKYSWISFFDYAGFLLLNKKLNVFETNNIGTEYYQRLSDVDIDISLPNKSYDIELKLYHQDLLDKKEVDPEWYNEIKIDTIKELFRTQIDGNIEYFMLYGFVQQRMNEEYKVRSFLMIESMFIEKNDEFKKLKSESDILEWDFDIHVSREHLYSVYFGELYWADNICESETEKIAIPTGECKATKRIMKITDILREDGFSDKNIDEEIEEKRIEKIWLNSESTLLDYLWESDSKTLPGFGEFYPGVKMGKYLNLKADPKSGKILDERLEEAYKCIHFEDKNFFKNTFNYMRTDLIKKYMEEKNLALIYQVKQHSHDENYLHNRKVKFFIIE